MSYKDLITPRFWADIKRRQATKVLGSPEAAEYLADAKKFDLLAEIIEDLDAELTRVMLEKEYNGKN